jgi:hypothetical protein
VPVRPRRRCPPGMNLFAEIIAVVAAAVLLIAVLSGVLT